MRCNIVSPVILTDQHLIAEKRELRMIPPLFEKRRKKLGSKMFRDIPGKCVLGQGHMLFWTNKLAYLSIRFDMIVNEMKYRGFNPDPSITLGVTQEMIDCSVIWTPSRDDEKLLKSRIYERIMAKPDWYRFRGKPISIEWIEDIYGPQ